jgi:glycosyltransferase A (GT-A) superfamily protein (DUF2064 family)
MKNALEEQSNNYQNCLLIGTDCPQINQQYIDLAFQYLNDGNDVVLGPASDGGYVLVGIGQLFSDMFENIDWGTDKVLQQTLDILQNNKQNYSLLPVLRDIDNEQDWLWWKSQNA